MPTAFTALITEREHYYATQQPKKAPKSFQHTPADGKPTKVTFPGALTVDEQAEVRAWRAYGTAPVAAAAIAKVAEYVANDAANRAWNIADDEAREAQYNWVRADASVLNKGTTSVGSSETGAGSTPPPAHVPPQPVHTAAP